jgi:uncharacterized RDD family membrane protein YckC
VVQGDSAADARYAPPQAVVEDIEPEAGGIVLATRMRRFWASMIDVAIAAVIIGLLAYFSPWNPWADMETANPWAPAPVDALVQFGIFVAVHGWLLATRGQTAGKAFLGIRVVRGDGGRAGAGRLIGIRYGVGAVLMVIPMIGQVYALVDVLFIFGRKRRCLHDLIADTIVVRA